MLRDRYFTSLPEGVDRLDSQYSADAIFGKGTGYFRNDQQVSSTTSDIMDMTEGQEPDQQIQLTDLMPNVKFEVPKIKAADTVKTFEAGKMEVTNKADDLREDVDAVGDAYMAADKMAKAQIINAIMETSPEKGAAVVSHIFPRDQAPLVVDMLRPMVNLGPVGNAYEILNSIKQQEGAPLPNEVADVLQKALTALHQQSAAPSGMDADSFNASKPKPTQTQFDFTKVQTPKQLLEFIQRDPMEDPIMQQVADAHQGIDNIEENELATKKLAEKQQQSLALYGSYGIEETAANIASMPPVTVPKATALVVNAEIAETIADAQKKKPDPAVEIDPPQIARVAALGAVAGGL